MRIGPYIFLFVKIQFPFTSLSLFSNPILQLVNIKEKKIIMIIIIFNKKKKYNYVFNVVIIGVGLKFLRAMTQRSFIMVVVHLFTVK